MTPEFVSQTPQRPQKDTRAQQGMAGRNPDADLHPNIDNEPCSAVGGGQRCGALEHLKWYWQATGNTRQDGKAEFRWVGGHRRDGEGMDVTVNMHKMWKRRNGGGGKPSWTLWPQGAPRPQLPTLTELAAAAGGGLLDDEVAEGAEAAGGTPGRRGAGTATRSRPATPGSGTPARRRTPSRSRPRSTAAARRAQAEARQAGEEARAEDARAVARSLARGMVDVEAAGEGEGHDDEEAEDGETASDRAWRVADNDPSCEDGSAPWGRPLPQPREEMRQWREEATPGGEATPGSAATDEDGPDTRAAMEAEFGGEGARPVDAGGGEEAVDAASPWPPLINDKPLPPRLRSSPPGKARRHLDFTIVYSLCQAKATEDMPHPPNPMNDDPLMLESVDFFMRMSADLYRRMETKGMLVHAFAGHERATRPHAQQSVRFSTAREITHFIDLLRVLLHHFCIMQDERTQDMYHRLTISARKGQSMKYNDGYTQKTFPNQPEIKRPGDCGRFIIGASDEYAQEAMDTYWAYAGNEKAAAYKKAGGGHGGYQPRGRDVHFITKSNAFAVGNAHVAVKQMGDRARQASTVAKNAWTLEGGQHALAPSWAIQYGAKNVDEAQLYALQLVNEMPYRACDKMLVRKAMFNYYLQPSAVSSDPVFFRPRMVMQADIEEQLSEAEYMRWMATDELPPHADLAQRFPQRPSAPIHLVIADAHYNFPGTTSHDLGLHLGNAGMNVHALIYDDAKGAGVDPDGARSLGFIDLAMSEAFARRKLSELYRMHLYSFIDPAYLAVVTRELKLADAQPDEPVLPLLINAFGMDTTSYHEVHHRVFPSAVVFRQWLETYTPSPTLKRYTHTAIIRTEERQSWEDFQVGEAMIYTDRADRKLSAKIVKVHNAFVPAYYTISFEDPRTKNIVERTVGNRSLVRSPTAERILDAQAILRTATAGLDSLAPAAETFPPPPGAAPGPPLAAPRLHHYALAWRYKYEIVAYDIGRESMGEFVWGGVRGIEAPPSVRLPRIRPAPPAAYGPLDAGGAGGAVTPTPSDPDGDADMYANMMYHDSGHDDAADCGEDEAQCSPDEDEDA